jgi:hypothetical protein
MAHGHAEVEQVGPRDGRVRLVGRLADTGAVDGDCTEKQNLSVICRPVQT